MPEELIQTLWIGDELSANEQLCLRSYLYHRHEVHLYAYSPLKRIPEGVILRDAAEIIPLGRLFKDSSNTYASFADWFRLKLLEKYGGWWVDTDTVCLRPFDFPGEYCFSSELNFDGFTMDVNNTYIKAPAGAAFLTELTEKIEHQLKKGEIISWGSVGVYLFRQTMPEYEQLHPFISAPGIFCPFNYFDLSSLICETNDPLPSMAHAIHLWNEIWRRGFLNKNAKYHPSSVFEQLKRKYL
jgi:hypothetical protein